MSDRVAGQRAAPGNQSKYKYVKADEELYCDDEYCDDVYGWVTIDLDLLKTIRALRMNPDMDIRRYIGQVGDFNYQRPFERW